MSYLMVLKNESMHRVNFKRQSANTSACQPYSRRYGSAIRTRCISAALEGGKWGEMINALFNQFKCGLQTIWNRATQHSDDRAVKA